MQVHQFYGEEAEKAHRLLLQDFKCFFLIQLLCYWFIFCQYAYKLFNRSNFKLGKTPIFLKVDVELPDHVSKSKNVWPKRVLSFVKLKIVFSDIWPGVKIMHTMFKSMLMYLLTCGKEFTMKKLLYNTLFGNKRFMLEEMTYSEFYFANSTLGISLGFLNQKIWNFLFI